MCRYEEFSRFFKSSARNRVTSLKRATFSGLTAISVWCASRQVRVICSRVGLTGSGVPGLDIAGQLQRAGGDFEEMQRAQIFQQLGDARVGIQQFDAAVVRCGRLVQLQAEPGQHAEKGAVHEHAFRQINDEMAVALLRSAR